MSAHPVAPPAGPAPGTATAPLLDVRDLRVEFQLRKGTAVAVAGLSYQLARGEVLAVVGESGSGKSVAAHAVLGVLPTPPARVAGGQVIFDGQDLLTLPEPARRAIRGERIALVSQASSLNPVFTVGWQIGEPFRVHRGMSHKDSLRRAAELLDRVEVPNSRRRVHDYPHQFSGGMRQRASIAMAMALDPDVLIADEPTTALDVTIQAQVMQLLCDMRAESGMGLILITHDLNLVAEWSDNVVVMYAGRECETGSIADVFSGSAHPYTRGLIASIPDVHQKKRRLEQIGGSPPDPMSAPPGCPFHPRCAWAEPACATHLPVLHDVGPGRRSSCHRSTEVVSHV